MNEEFFVLRATDCGYICDCVDGFQGQNCTHKLETRLASGVQLYYDHVTPVNTGHNLLIVLEDLGDTECSLEIRTHNYAMLNTLLPFPKHEHFNHSDNIRNTARNLGIVRLLWIPEKPGYFLVLNATIVSGGRSQIELVINDYKSKENYYIWYFEHLSIVDEQAGCYPLVQLSEW